MVNWIPDVREQKKDSVEGHNRHRVRQQAGRPSRSETTAVMAAIERLIADSRGNGIEIEFYDDVPTEELPSELQMVVYPIVHELLLNACRHSRSQNVLVGLAQDDELAFTSRSRIGALDLTLERLAQQVRVERTSSTDPRSQREHKY